MTRLQSEFCVLLKPVAPFTIKAFVELALETANVQRRARETEKLRVDRDTLLQYVLEVNIKLQQYDQQRSNFLARALHDFRAPLTALHGYCGLLSEGKCGGVTPEQRDLLERMGRSTARVTKLAGNALDLLLQGRVERPTDRKESDIEDILTRALDDVRPFLTAKEIRVETHLSKHRGKLFLESEQIQQVFVNLLENSCRFAPRSGKIEVRGYPVTGEPHDADWSKATAGPSSVYRIDVLDSGPGVPSELVTHIFEEYASYSGNGDRSGGGLGLAICKAIVTAHGGTVWASAHGEGGKFSFLLPLSVPDVSFMGHPLPCPSSTFECVQCH